MGRGRGGRDEELLGNGLVGDRAGTDDLEYLELAIGQAEIRDPRRTESVPEHPEHALGPSERGSQLPHQHHAADPEGGGGQRLDEMPRRVEELADSSGQPSLGNGKQGESREGAENESRGNGSERPPRGPRTWQGIAPSGAGSPDTQTGEERYVRNKDREDDRSPTTPPLTEERPPRGSRRRLCRRALHRRRATRLGAANDAPQRFTAAPSRSASPRRRVPVLGPHHQPERRDHACFGEVAQRRRFGSADVDDTAARRKQRRDDAVVARIRVLHDALIAIDEHTVLLSLCEHRTSWV